MTAQTVLTAARRINQASTAAERTIRLPPGAYLTAGTVFAVANMTGGTTPTVTVTDAASGTPFGSITGTSIDAANELVTLAAASPKFYPNGTTITLAYTGTPTAADHIVTLEYVVLGRVTEQHLG